MVVEKLLTAKTGGIRLETLGSLNIWILFCINKRTWLFCFITFYTEASDSLRFLLSFVLSYLEDWKVINVSVVPLGLTFMFLLLYFFFCV